MIVSLPTSAFRVDWYIEFVYSSLLFSMDIICHKVARFGGTTTFFEDFELVMIFLRSSQTRVDQSLCKVYETFWLGQLVFCGHNVM